MKLMHYLLSGLLLILILSLSSFGTFEESKDSAESLSNSIPSNTRIADQQSKILQTQKEQILKQQIVPNIKISNNRFVGPLTETKKTYPKPAANNKIQVALLLDTSNSMDGLIDQAKSQLWKMVNELSNAIKDGEAPMIELSLYEYGNSLLSKESGFIRKVERLTNDLEIISEKLFQLKTNGGNEYCAWAMKDAIEVLEWSSNSNDLKMIFIAGNEPFTQGPVDYKKVCSIAKEKGIVINTIHCGDYDQGIKTMWGDGASCANGKYMNINQAEKVVHIPTPYDDTVLELNNKLNDTYIGFGQKGSYYFSLQSSNDASSAQYSSANTRTRAFFKSKSNYVNTSWDLVDATDEDYDGFMKTLKEEELPKEMQTMSEDERKSYIELNRNERAELQKELKELEVKVKKYISDLESSGDAATMTLDNVMIEAIRKQASDKGFEIK